MKGRIKQIRRAHNSARPKADNPAWCNTHRDLGVALNEIERLEAERDKYKIEAHQLTEERDEIERIEREYDTKCDQLEAEIARKWQSIETAPKGNGDKVPLTSDSQYVDAPRILLYFPAEDVIEVGYWDWYYAEGVGYGYEGCSAWCTGEYQPAGLGCGEPSHWMPLPTTPTQDQDND